ncbi:MAG: UDP-glucose 4-epimerase GalE [Clostridiales bacterium]|jgi:UDP-glucose 4-epimerase|nr:UDP-glucose 4-epimerase GalE [Clostridiales bacterium]
MNVLVCGGAGYIGSHAVAALLDKGYGVIALDNLEKGHKEAVWESAQLCVGDLRDKDFVNSVFKRCRVDAVMDFAAYSLVSESMADPLKYYRNNVFGMINLLEAMNENGVKHIVFSSTASVYGIPKHIPLVETEIPNPINPYGESKLAVEKMLKWADAVHGIKNAVLRYFNVGGAHPSGRIGEDHDPESHLIPRVLLSVIRKDNELELFGDDYDTPDGSCVRDYIHISDLVDAHILALERIRGEGISGTYNLGNGKGFSNKEIIKAAEQVTGERIDYKTMPRRPGDPAILVASSDKAVTELGWAPKHKDLNDIMSSAWEWHKNHPEGFK